MLRCDNRIHGRSRAQVLKPPAQVGRYPTILPWKVRPASITGAPPPPLPARPPALPVVVGLPPAVVLLAAPPAPDAPPLLVVVVESPEALQSSTRGLQRGVAVELQEVE